MWFDCSSALAPPFPGSNLTQAAEPAGLPLSFHCIPLHTITTNRPSFQAAGLGNLLVVPEISLIHLSKLLSLKTIRPSRLFIFTLIWVIFLMHEFAKLSSNFALCFKNVYQSKIGENYVVLKLSHFPLESQVIR